MTRGMKDSGIEWVGKVPTNWQVLPNKYIMKKFKDICWKYNDENILSLSINGVVVRNFDDGGKVPASFDGYQFLYPNNLLMCLFDYDVTPRCIGLIKNKGITSPAYSQFKMLNDNYTNYFYYYYLMLDYDKTILHLAKNLRHSFTEDQLGNIKVLKPSVEEQHKIAHYLDVKCYQIDSLLSQIQEQIDTLEQYKKSVITEAVIKGLNRDVEMKDSGIEWASKIPSHWQSMPNKYIMTKVKNLCSKYSGENILSLTMNGVIIRDLEAGGKMPTSFDGYQFVYPGNLLMCLFDYDVTPRCIGLVKNEGITSPAYSQFEIRNGNYAPYYYYYYLMIDNTKELLHLAKNLRHSFTEEQLGAICVPVPPVQEQKQIVEYLDNKCSQIDSIISDKKKQLETLEQYKKSLIYEYVTGKKEVK